MIDSEHEEDLSPAIFRKFNKQKSKIKSRAPGSISLPDDAEASSEVLRPKKSVTSRVKQNTNHLRSGPGTKSVYSSDYLASLRDSTPTTPQDFVGETSILPTIDVGRPPQETSDLASAIADNNIGVPEPAKVRSIIAEREIRRRAGENYIPLSDALSLDLRAQSDTRKRMQTEDEVDILGGDGTEGLTGYESDTLPIGDRSRRMAETDRRIQIQTMLDDASGIRDLSDNRTSIHLDGAVSTDDSDSEWERTQTQKSAARAAQHVEKSERSSIGIPKIMPIETVSEVLATLQARLDIAKSKLEHNSIDLAAIESEQVEIADREEVIKLALQQASLNFETARLRVGGLDEIGK